MFSEPDLLPLSALQHLAFCERQCALIHIEQAWAENLYTAEGRIFHERTHEAFTETRGEIRIAHGVRLSSLRLGLSGIADSVEFHPISEPDSETAQARSVRLEGRRGRWRPFPVEFKRGKPKKNRCDTVQLCAQGICLEEMLGVEIAGGALFYGKVRRRLEVAFDPALREETERLAERLHEMIRSGRTPPAVYGPKCDQCSLFNLCHPKTVASGKSAKGYLSRSLRSLMRDDPFGEIGEVAP